MIGHDPIAAASMHVPEDFGDVRQQFQRQFGIEQRVVRLHSGQPWIFVLLDKFVVGILRKGKRTQIQRVDGRQRQ